MAQRIRYFTDGTTWLYTRSEMAAYLYGEALRQRGVSLDLAHLSTLTRDRLLSRILMVEGYAGA